MTLPLKILYGVQATGQGHISKARVLGPALQAEGAEVDFLFSGRVRDELFSMEPFGDFQTRRGLTFAFNRGRVNIGQTLLRNDLTQFAREIGALDLNPYDLVITDYEPVTAWAAKLKRKFSLGISHQYAFDKPIPKMGFNVVSQAIMQWHSPAAQALGVHWHHFGLDILPPIFAPPDAAAVDPRKILVYLNFESLAEVSELLKPIKGHDFYVYSSRVSVAADEGQLKFRPLSTQFRDDLATCSGVICGAGFELPTEAMAAGKKILVKPLRGQPEQLSNALALEQLGLGQVMKNLDRRTVERWLDQPQPRPVIFPDTAKALAHWIVAGRKTPVSSLVAGLWGKLADCPAEALPI